jgi:hypothetical protein
MYACMYVSVTVVDMSPGSMRNLMLYVCVVCMYVSVCVCVCGYMKADSEPVCRRCGHVSRLDVERDVKHTHTLSHGHELSLSIYAATNISIYAATNIHICLHTKDKYTHISSNSMLFAKCSSCYAHTHAKIPTLHWDGA